MSRNGQVYFVCNRISKLEELKLFLEKYIPDCRVVIGHGQMAPEQLEKVIMGFINYDYDVLLSTTIVENGIDVGNANTIIIEDAHKFGLSDLHQMRGRVGRSNKRHFAISLLLQRVRLLQRHVADWRRWKLSVSWEVVLIWLCRIWIFVVQVICWVRNRVVLWKIWVMKPIRRFFRRL